MKINTQSLRARITKHLTNNPRTRDNDNLLITLIWSNELNRLGVDPKEDSFAEAMKHLLSGKLTSPESIRRTRQFIQQSIPGLRGNKYAARQASQEQVKQDLIYSVKNK
jgi:hypothetical protein